MWITNSGPRIPSQTSLPLHISQMCFKSVVSKKLPFSTKKKVLNYYIWLGTIFWHLLQNTVNMIY